MPAKSLAACQVDEDAGVGALIRSGVDTPFAIDVVCAGPAFDQVVAIEAPQQIIAVSALEDIGIRPAADFIGKGAPRHTPDVLTRIVILERTIQRPI
ncbi:hypothetical protein D3C85_1288740 [compost metagenome]